MPVSSDAPADKIFLVTKNDSTDLPNGICRGLLVGVAGAANLHTRDGALKSNVPLQAGYNPIVVRRVLTGGVASDIWALY